jgi:hypothetical protein
MAFHLSSVLVFVGALIAAIGVYMETSENWRLSGEIAKKSDEIAELNKKIVSHVTGGGSFCYVVMRYDNGDPDHLYLSLLHKGEFPIFDVIVQLTDVDHRKQMFQEQPGHDVEASMKAMHTIPIGTVPPGEVEKIFWKVDVAGRDSRRFTILLQARNGYVDQRLALRKVGNEWKSAIRAIPKMYATDETTDKVEIIDKAFPRTASGDVAW